MVEEVRTVLKSLTLHRVLHLLLLLRREAVRLLLQEVVLPLLVQSRQGVFLGLKKVLLLEHETASVAAVVDAAVQLCFVVA